MRLTRYGQQVLTRTVAVAALLVLVAGALMVILNGAYWVPGGQKFYNMVYIIVIMPTNFLLMSLMARIEIERRYGCSVQDNSWRR